VQSLSPPKPAGLDAQHFCRLTPNWLRNTDSQKKFEKKIHGKHILKLFFKLFLNYFLNYFFADYFLKFLHKNAERSVAFGEYIYNIYNVPGLIRTPGGNLK
jgi:hypothetical protein